MRRIETNGFGRGERFAKAELETLWGIFVGRYRVAYGAWPTFIEATDGPALALFAEYATGLGAAIVDLDEEFQRWTARTDRRATLPGLFACKYVREFQLDGVGADAAVGA